MSTKPRSDSKLDSLPANQKQALEQWLFEENISLDEAQKRVWQDFNVRCSTASLSGFYQRVSQRRLLERITENARKATEIEDQFQKNKAPVPAAVVKLVTQLAFEEITAGKDLDKDFVVKLTKLAVDSGLKAKKLELDERRIALLEEKAQQATEAEKALSDSKLTPEEREKRMRQIFGLS